VKQECQGKKTDDGAGGRANSTAAALYSIHPLALSNVRALTRHSPALAMGVCSVTLTLQSGVTLAPLCFATGGVKALLSALRQHARVERSDQQPNTYLINSTDVSAAACHECGVNNTKTYPDWSQLFSPHLPRARCAHGAVSRPVATLHGGLAAATGASPCRVARST
jgi:hypothetical protein